jgi:hypothetical protein
MQINSGKDLVRQYARMQLTAERLQSTNQPLPPDLVAGLQFMESLSRDFSPEQQRALSQEVQLHKDSLLAVEMRGTAQAIGQRQQAAAALAQQLRDRGVQDATRSLSRDGQGLTQAQFHELRQTGKYTVPARERQRDAVARQFATLGLGDNPDKIIARMGELHDNDRALTEHAQKLFPGDVLNQSRFKNALKSAVIEHAAIERAEQRAGADAFKQRTVEATPEERRRADVLFAIGQEDREGRTLAGDEINPASLEDKGLRGAVARAYAAHEAVEDPLAAVSGDEYEQLERVAAGGAP